MGFETIRVELRGGRASVREAEAVIRQLPFARPDGDSLRTHGSAYFVLDGPHVIEVEVKCSPLSVSCRFTLCHPSSVDEAFLVVLRELMARLGVQATLCDDVQPGTNRAYTLAEFDDFAAAALRAIAVRRAEWVAAFGDETFAATTVEAHRRVILPRCVPVVGQLA